MKIILKKKFLNGVFSLNGGGVRGVCFTQSRKEARRTQRFLSDLCGLCV